MPESRINFCDGFVTYRPYQVVKKQPNVDMFWVQFYVIFLIWAFLFESMEKIVNIDTKWKYWKSIAEIDSTFRQYVWLYCATISLGCWGGEQGIETPCIYFLFLIFLINLLLFVPFKIFGKITAIKIHRWRGVPQWKH